MLAHVPEMVRRFGPLQGTSSEIPESLNRHLRGYVRYSNHQANSFDAAGHASIGAAKIYLANRGWWCHDGTHMTQAGEKCIEALNQPRMRRLLGLPVDPAAPIHTMSIQLPPGDLPAHDGLFTKFGLAGPNTRTRHLPACMHLSSAVFDRL
ncbi:hypothetical protein K470DRAFT_13498 [Piedraia hortae CBS 480.64]|uniref:Uncharacterized protein n=1 Tax=Piedraia hortae CBS 480.64 TaxID=1314780 RepID=A0A6A7BP33_9PEZI|nr:hypothetical protein K470DRAFT_13498 [Piedraia hortae CBS 480.64]